MDHTPPICQQCGAPLPRQARWRGVTCGYCAAEVSAGARVVEAAYFRRAYERATAATSHFDCAGQRYRILAPLADGAHARIMLAETVGAPPARVVLKVAHAPLLQHGHGHEHEHEYEHESQHGACTRLRQEHAVLTRLQDDSPAGAAYFTQRLPQALALGAGAAPGEQARATLVLRHRPGLWGSLAALRANHPGGIDARHLVWMWRRTLDVLAYVHAIGWAHNAIHPGHLLVQPRDHGIVIIGWASAGPADDAARARDLRRTAWSMRALLGDGHGAASLAFPPSAASLSSPPSPSSPSSPSSPPALPPSLPAPLAVLLRRASEADTDDDGKAWDAARTDRELLAAAAASFGMPRFIDLPTTPAQAAVFS